MRVNASGSTVTVLCDRAWLRVWALGVAILLVVNASYHLAEHNNQASYPHPQPEGATVTATLPPPSLREESLATATAPFAARNR